MAFLSKLPDNQNDPHRSQWELLVTRAELEALLQDSGAAVGFVVHLPKDTPLVNETAVVFIRRMREELADRHQVVREHTDPEIIAHKVREHAHMRLQELRTLLGREPTPSPPPAPPTPGDSSRPRGKRWWQP